MPERSSSRPFTQASSTIWLSGTPAGGAVLVFAASAKAALESTTRYLARDLGKHSIRVNLIAAGPIRTMAMRSIPGAEQFEGLWGERAPLSWDMADAEPAAKGCVALLSDWFPATTGEIVHVDGGVHAMGA